MEINTSGPNQQLFVAAGLRLNRERALHASYSIDDDTNMHVQMRVDAEDDLRRGIRLFHASSFAVKWRCQTMPKDRTLKVQNKAPIGSLAAGSALPR
jgi:hypothetical protein